MNIATGLVHQVMGGGGGGLDPLTAQIYDLVNGELTLQETGGNIILTDTNPHTIYIEDNPLGCSDFRTLFVDGTTLGAPTVSCFVYYRIVPGGVFVLSFPTSLNDAVVNIVDLKPNRYGIKIDLVIDSGDPPTGNIPWEIFMEA